jgi:hypothetical protein
VFPLKPGTEGIRRDTRGICDLGKRKAGIIKHGYLMRLH